MDIPNYQNNYNGNDIESNTQQNLKTEDKKSSFAACCGFLTLEFYQPFFDVDQKEVYSRIKLSMIPYNNEFYQETKQKPDLYGPFWIYTTLIFMIFASGNLSMYLKGQKNYDFEYVPVAAGLIYGIGFIFPIIMCFIMRTFQSDLNYLQFICLYGYSLSCFIPIILLCFIPVEILQWILMIYGLVNSLGFIFMNLRSYVENLQNQKKYLIVGLTLGCQIVLVLMFKLYFFGKIYQI